jgi:hypothetical protein
MMRWARIAEISISFPIVSELRCLVELGTTA